MPRTSPKKLSAHAPAAPAPPPDPADLPAPLTIFLTQQEREQALRKLGRRHRDRRLALLAALKITPAKHPAFPISKGPSA